ncbi:MAG: hypothetical protein K5851_05350 [Lachnospiraceae bacterium]|nr:hypothetical protein [Lachnospiraceae bacterium]
MSKYIVEEDKHERYQKNLEIPLLNTLAAIIWSIVVFQKVVPFVGKSKAYAIAIAFIVLFVYLSYKPIISILPCIASGVAYTMSLWLIPGLVSNVILKIILKIVFLIFVIMVELTIFGNATIPWLEEKTARPPRIYKIDD